MLNFFRYIRGYLIIKISGEFLEQILNTAAKNRISIWNLCCKRDCVMGCITISGFKKLRIAKRGLHNSIKIVEKSGLPFLLKKHKKRIGVPIGALLFLAVLKLLSSFVWCIEVQGNNNVEKEQIISLCSDLGIHEGTLKKDINAVLSAQRLLLKCPELAWAALNIEGSVLTVNVTEITSPEILGNNPVNLKASSDGTIKRIDVTAGNTVVKVGDTVAKGDVLVSGIGESAAQTSFVHSKGSVIAVTKRRFFAEGSFEQTVKIKTGVKKKRCVLSFFGADIPLYIGELKGSFKTSKKVYNMRLFSRELPIRLTVRIFEQTADKKILLSEEELLSKLEKDIKKQIQQTKCKSIEIENSEIFTTKNGFRVVKSVNCEENIAKEEILLINTIN